MDDQNESIFPPKFGHLFQFLKKGRVDLPLFPSSYAPAVSG